MLKMKRAPTFLLAALGLSAGLNFGAAFGQTAADPLDACAAEKDDAARLACFDRQMALRHGGQHAGAQGAGAAPAASPHPAPIQAQAQTAVPQVTQAQVTPQPHGQTAVAPSPPPQTAAPPPDANYGLQGEALHRKLKEEGKPARAVPPVSATVARLVPVSRTEYAFQLDNGQVWQQTDGRPDLRVKVNDRVTINAGLFGDFFFTTPDRQRIRVKRIR